MHRPANPLHQVIEHLRRGRRVEADPGLLAQRLDRLDRSMEMRPRLGMNGDDVGPCLGESLEIGIDRRDHQVNVNSFFCVA